MAKDKKMEETNVAEVSAENQPETKPVVEIIRGRMPLPIVKMIKFAPEGETDGALAAKFRTTNGKVSDIRKERNFGYITENYKPSQEQLDKAKAYADQLEDKSIAKEVSKLTVASADEQAVFDAARKSVRKTTKVTPKEEVDPEEAAQAADGAADEALDELTQ